MTGLIEEVLALFEKGKALNWNASVQVVNRILFIIHRKPCKITWKIFLSAELI